MAVVFRIIVGACAVFWVFLGFLIAQMEGPWIGKLPFELFLAWLTWIWARFALTGKGFGKPGLSFEEEDAQREREESMDQQEKKL